MAREKGIDLALLRGTGPAGRIIAADLSEKDARPASSSIADRKIPISMMRKTIAKRLQLAKNEAPHFYLTVSARMDSLLKWREDLNAHAGVLEGKFFDNAQVAMDIVGKVHGPNMGRFLLINPRNARSAELKIIGKISHISVAGQDIQSIKDLAASFQMSPQDLIREQFAAVFSHTFPLYYADRKPLGVAIFENFFKGEEKNYPNYNS